MERLHWVRHRCRRLLGADSLRGWYTPHQSPRRPKERRRVVVTRHGSNPREFDAASRSYQSNAIRTTKYSLLSFIPKNLFQQFHRVANLYFLFLALLNWVPVIEAFQKEITMIPLLVVLAVTAVKDALEDYRRYLFDKKVNNNIVQVYCGAERTYTAHRWKDVRVGNLVRLSCDDIIPADLLLLFSSDPRGVCYLETANLDGETNLKQREVVPGLPLQDSEFTPESFHCRVECEPPNDNLRSFRGFIEHSNGHRVGLRNSNLLLRSCTVRNTQTVIGIVLYAGHETKAMMNNSGPRYKRSSLERRLNTNVLWCVFLLLAMCLTAAVGHGLWLNAFQEPLFQVEGEPSAALGGFYVFWTMIIVLQVLIPISLYVSIEIVKLGQIYFIHNDVALYNERLDARVQCRALNITENLGQVQYLFSDKTGTLTENQMAFCRCSVFGVEYPHQDNARRLQALETPAGRTRPPSGCGGKSLSCRSVGCSRSSVSLHTLTAETDETDEDVQLSCSHTTSEVVPDPELQAKLQRLCSCGWSKDLELRYVTDFFLALVLCNSVMVSSPGRDTQLDSEVPRPHSLLEDTELKGSPALSPLSSSLVQDGPEDISTGVLTGGRTLVDRDTHSMCECEMETQRTCRDRDSVTEDSELRPRYEAEDPDEAALVRAAVAYGCVLRGRTADRVLLDLPGLDGLSVPVLHMLPFDSNRKRMSVVVRHPLTQQVVVYTKGADSVVMDLFHAAAEAEWTGQSSALVREQTQRHVNAYAREGLRTLCFAKKVVEEADYESWLKLQLQAERSIENREELLLESAQLLETNLTLLGSSGIVDRLQDEVPETVEVLQRAGIRLWVLTGDKQETAVSVAFSCRLIQATDRLLTANCSSQEACAQLLEELKVEVEVESGCRSWTEASGCVLVVDGRTLDWALQEELSGSFLELSGGCKAVICCRSTPLQKSRVVQLVRSRLGVMTLSVGDGANDVSMIQVADVGVGISGQEGMQAVMSSDFAISRFKHLSRLLLVHGRWSAARLANMALYFFYKNVMFVNLLFWYQFFCGFSGSVMTNSWVLILFNLIFTSVPPLVYGVLDQNAPAGVLMGRPELYQTPPTRKLFSPLRFWIVVLDGFYQSLVCFFVPYFALAGSDVGELSLGSPINASALLSILLHQALESSNLTWIHLLVLLLSAASYFLFVLLFSLSWWSFSPPADLLGVETLQMSHPLFYIICALSTVTALLPRLLLRVLSNTIHPSPRWTSQLSVDSGGHRGTQSSPPHRA